MHTAFFVFYAVAVVAHTALFRLGAFVHTACLVVSLAATFAMSVNGIAAAYTYDKVLRELGLCVVDDVESHEIVCCCNVARSKTRCRT